MKDDKSQTEWTIKDMIENTDKGHIISHIAAILSHRALSEWE